MVAAMESKLMIEATHGHGNFISRGYDGYGNFIPKRQNGVGNFSPYAKSYGHTSYDAYGGYERVNAKYVKNNPYGVAKVESLTLSMVDEIPRIRSFHKIKLKSLETHVE
ncbi:hypothetical protein M9H77_16415 [Catharanthus roseus]|uniref:Uncharacterized protein n=1 Tax=Catharanthus roseus TaxID=4058 RepID=A0ACC0B1U9_CATRO|nr:hypothetical protein M9H77_16415 [Catharanthus roseus]